MKPRTAEQKKVWRLSLRLSSKVSKTRREYMTDGAWAGLYADNYKRHVRCLHCGTMVTTDPKTAKGKRCPVCGSHFRDDIHMPASKKIELWVLSAEVHYGYQVFRKYVSTRIYSKHGMSRTFLTEVSQNWIRKDGLITTVSRNLNFMNWNQTYCLGSEMTIKGTYSHQNNWYYDICPGMRHIPETGRGLFREDLAKECRLSIIEYTSEILKKMYAESILKILGRDALVSYISSSIPEHCWRLALRYQWHPHEWRWEDWRDHIRNMDYLGMDTHNPKLLLPHDFDAEHTRVNILANKKRDKEREEQERRDTLRRAQEAEKDRMSYINRLKELLPLTFTDGGLTFTVIQSPADMIMEGSAMKHCVGSYVNKKESLIMSCRDDQDKRVETIEVSLERYEVLQSRGKCNIHTQWHEQILSAMNRNMGEIRRLDAMRRKRLRRKVRAAV